MESKTTTLSRTERVWSFLSVNIREWLTTVDHKRLGVLYILVALVFLIIAGIEASIMRFQLIRPNNDLVSPELFNRMFTMHGTTMIFFVAMPLVFGFANYLTPLMIGARDMAFPRLNAFSFWIMLFGAIILYASFFAGGPFHEAGSAPDVGWFAYAPLTSRTFSPGHSTDFWTIGILVSGFGSVGTAINILATILCSRCAGMTLGKMPLFAWLNLVMAGLVILALGPLTAAQFMLLIDRYLGGRFFDTTAGGSAFLWMHFFWIFGHPEVYVLVLPAFAIASEIIPVFSRKVIFGYPVMVGATIAIGFVAMSVWAHHMFAVGMDANANNAFVFTTMAIAVPTGIKIFNWLATMWGGKLQFKTPMLFCVAFLFQFLVAGLTGVMLASAPFDWQLTGSYFVVAHFHYVIVGGILFCIFGGFYYWFPKMSGQMLDETLGKLHFWLFLIGFHLTFDFMHVPGILGMPRRIYTYEPGRGWEVWNLIVTIGVVFQAAAIVVFAGNLFWSYFKGKTAGNDPWDAWTLEWSTSSPAPVYNFASLPVVRSRRPLWDLKHPDDPDWGFEPSEPFSDPKADESGSLSIPASTPFPLIFAFGVALIFTGLVTTALISILGAIVALCGCVGWFCDVLPQEKHELLTIAATDPISTNRPEVAEVHHITGQRHRARLPIEIYPMSAGIKGGLAGGSVMAIIAALWATLARHGVWYPLNLLAAGFFPERATAAQLSAFHWDALIIGTAIFLLATILVGLLYGAILPMLPRHPVLLTGAIMPVFASAVAHTLFGIVNPIFNERIDWTWFIVSQIAFGITAGIIVSRNERLSTWQHLPFLERAGLEEDFDENGGADAR
jgi:cytochrome c oxidase subunit I